MKVYAHYEEREPCFTLVATLSSLSLSPHTPAPAPGTPGASMPGAGVSTASELLQVTPLHSTQFFFRDFIKSLQE